MKRLNVKKVMLWGTLSILFIVLSTLSYQMKALADSSIEMTNMMRARLKKNPDLHIKKTWIKLADVSPYLLKSVICTEDPNYFVHHGFSIEFFWEALKKNIKQGNLLSGGSTIPQQLVKNLYFSEKRSILRKMGEITYALLIDLILPKKKILEIYLNIIEWGPGIFGIEEASKYWFNKSARFLRPNEAARLALIINSPLDMNPHKLDYQGELFSKFIVGCIYRDEIVKNQDLKKYLDVEIK